MPAAPCSTRSCSARSAARSRHDAAYSFAPKMPASRPRTMNTAVTHRMNRRLTHSLPASSSRSISRSACGGMLFSVFMFLRVYLNSVAIEATIEAMDAVCDVMPMISLSDTPPSRDFIGTTIFASGDDLGMTPRGGRTVHVEHEDLCCGAPAGCIRPQPSHTD